MKPKKITLYPHEYIIAAVPEYASGPGWANQPLWVHIARNDGTMRSECLQPDEQTSEQHTLFRVGAAVHRQLVESVAVQRKKEPRDG